jgi:uncharacterized protein
MKLTNRWNRTALLATIAAAALFSPGSEAVEAKMPIGKIGANNTVKLEVAQTEQEIERGLMYRTSLPEDQGMVFIFSPPRPVNFWMAHCFISLDMLFIKNGKIIKIFENVPPCHAQNERDCPTYPAGAGIEVSEVVELAAGYSKRHNVKVGDPVSFDMPK